MLDGRGILVFSENHFLNLWDLGIFGRSIFWIFEILKHYGISWKPPLKYRLPPCSRFLTGCCAPGPNPTDESKCSCTAVLHRNAYALVSRAHGSASGHRRRASTQMYQAEAILRHRCGPPFPGMDQQRDPIRLLQKLPGHSGFEVQGGLWGFIFYDNWSNHQFQTAHTLVDDG